MREIRNLLVLVVGGARGIGLETVDRLIASGARPLVLDQDADALARVAERHPGLETHRLDITDREGVRSFLQVLRERGERPGAAVLSAAVHGGSPIEAMSDAFIDRVIEINLTAHVKLLRDLLPVLADGARIVGLSSNAAEIGIPMEGVYAATKAAIERVYEALALEGSHRGLKPLVIQTGNVNTGFNETGNDYRPENDGPVSEMWRKVVTKIDSRNGIPPGQVADAILRLLAVRKPPFRTLVGTNALKTHGARRLVGTDFALRLVASTFGISRPA